MAIELKLLAASIALGFIQIFASAHFSIKQRGYKWAAGARDGAPDELSGVAGRLERASKNFQETFPLFAAALLVAHAAGTLGSLTSIGAQMYFWGRVAYLPIYAFGIPIVRSLVWNVATIGIFLILGSMV